MSENKLQIRAKILSAIINMQNNANNGDYIKETLAGLNEIEDKDAVLDILQKEFLKENSETKDMTVGFLIKELVNKEQIELSFFEALANPKINDALKTKLVGVLRECGKHVHYEQYVNYFENPDEIIDADTIKLLENAKINPESQIDFLDFLNALPTQEKEMLITSLTDDYDGDNLANILIPIILSSPYSDISQMAIKAIGESKSYLAYPVLKWIEENVDDLKTKSITQKSMSLLKLSGIKEDITKDYYKRLLSLSPVYKCFANFPDGHGNVGLIFSRKNQEGFIQTFTAVINDSDGILDCFGFNEITENEFDRIVKKFYTNDRVVSIPAKVCKYLLINAEKLSRLKFEEISYEYIAWKTIINDIDFEEIDMPASIEKTPISEFLLKQMYADNFFEKWFFDTQDNEAFSELIGEIAEKKITDIESLDNIISENKEKIFSMEVLQLFNNRLILSAYFEKLSDENVYSQILFSLAESGPIKEIFLTDILKKSVYEYFLLQKEKYNMTKSAKSIFTRRANKDSENIDIKFIEKGINEIEKNWVK